MRRQALPAEGNPHLLLMNKPLGSKNLDNIHLTKIERLIGAKTRTTTHHVKNRMRPFFGLFVATAKLKPHRALLEGSFQTEYLR